MMSHDELHSRALDYLVNHLNLIGEDPEGVHWIVREPVWQKNGSVARYALCDLIIGFYDKHLVVAELKASRDRKNEARHQLNQGEAFSRFVLAYTTRVVQKKFVVYREGVSSVHPFIYHSELIWR